MIQTYIILTTFCNIFTFKRTRNFIARIKLERAVKLAEEKKIADQETLRLGIVNDLSKELMAEIDLILNDRILNEKVEKALQKYMKSREIEKPIEKEDDSENPNAKGLK